VKLYVESTVWNYLFADHMPAEQAVMRSFVERASREDDLYISGVVGKELLATPDEAKRAKLIHAVDHASPSVLDPMPAVEEVARRIFELGILTERSENDAAHIAFSIVYGMDALVSWDTRHIVRLKTRRGVSGVCRMLGYRELELVTPAEV
jgi:predicted nucleic acid-binding protein